MVHTPTVRSERQFLKIDARELPEPDRGAILELHFHKTMLRRGNRNSFLNRRLQRGARPLIGSRPSLKHRALYQTEAHHPRMRNRSKRWPRLSITLLNVRGAGVNIGVPDSRGLPTRSRGVGSWRIICLG